MRYSVYNKTSFKRKYNFEIFVFIFLSLLMFIVIFNKFKYITTRCDYKYYISQDGSDNNNGSKKAPIKTLEGFKTLLINDIKNNKITKGKINVYINNGSYFFSDGFTLSNEDLQNKNISISFIGKGKNKVIFTGGISLDNSKLVSVNSSIFDIFKPKIYKYDLSNENLSFNLKDNTIDKAPELFLDNKPLTLAKYPNEGFLLTDKVNTENNQKGENTYSFTTTSKTPDDFNLENAYVSGYWYNDWSDSIANVISIKNNSFIINGNLPYGIKENQRFYIFNVFEALDNENEYYINYDTKELFAILDNKNKSELTLSLLNQPIVSLNNVSNITFTNITFENTTNNGIVIQNSKNISIENCIIRNLSMYGIYINTASNCNIDSNMVYNTGTGGIYASGGDRVTLTSSNIVINKNEIYNFSRIKKTYSAAINMNGVGITASNNKIHDAPHTGILFNGNDHLIENNEIYDICKETNDVGAIYTGRDWTYRGNIIRDNYIHDLTSSTNGDLVVGIYLDDCMSSAVVYDNKIENIPRGMLIGGGRDMIIRNNTIKDCKISLSFDDRGLSNNNIDTLNERLNAMPITSNVWLKKYPEIETLITTDPRIPYNNVLMDNKLYNTTEFKLSESVIDNGLIENNN